MTLKFIGTSACPFCGEPTPVGISREGRGNAVHLMCRGCQAQVQAHVAGPVGVRLIEGCAGASKQVPPMSPGFAAIRARLRPHGPPLPASEAHPHPTGGAGVASSAPATVDGGSQ